MTLTSEFSVAEGGPKVTVRFAGMSGLETYYVDGVEVLRVRRFFGGTRRFNTPGEPSREVTIEIKSFPSITVRAYVDGELRVPDLFPNLSGGGRKLNWLYWVVAYALCLLTLGAIYVICT